MFWIKNNILLASITVLLAGCTNENKSVLARFPIYEE
ncbi:MAG: hypothetical protein ACJAYC_000123 [Halieaceae bacterium]|jgi:hypothetical protein